MAYVAGDRTSDKDLIERLRARDDDAAFELAERYSARIRQLALRHVRNEEDADEVVQDFWIKNLRDEAHAVVLEKFSLVAGDDAGAFLPAMLQRVKTVVGQFGGVRMTENAEHAAIMFGIILLLHRPRRCILAKVDQMRKAEGKVGAIPVTACLTRCALVIQIALR